MAGGRDWKTMPCMYCNEPVGTGGTTDDGEFYQCADCRKGAESRAEAARRGYVGEFDAFAEDMYLINRIPNIRAVLQAL